MRIVTAVLAVLLVAMSALAAWLLRCIYQIGKGFGG